jgi:hypothetical protein
MPISKSSAFRTVLLAAGVAALGISIFLFLRRRLVEAFLLAFVGLTSISVSETDLDYTTKFNAQSFGTYLSKRSDISTFGKLCEIASYFCLLAALLSWVALD